MKYLFLSNLCLITYMIIKIYYMNLTHVFVFLFNLNIFIKVVYKGTSGFLPNSKV